MTADEVTRVASDRKNVSARSPIDAFASHPFRFLWEFAAPCTPEEAAAAARHVEQRAADLIVRNEPDPASAVALERLFMPYHQNGTFMIGVRRGTAPPFIRGESADFVSWVRTLTRSDLVRMLYAHALPPQVTSKEFEEVASVVADAFQYHGTNGHLYDQIPNQNYIDYIRRCIALYLFHDADTEFDTEAEYSEFVVDVAFAIVESRLTDIVKALSPATLRTLMAYSLLAGVVGLDMKCSHCAASALTTDNRAASQGESPTRRADTIFSWLVAKATEARLVCPELFAWATYEQLVLSRRCTLYFFPDDLGETVFDAFRVQAEMTFNRHLRVVFVPRNGRFHNDCAYADVEDLLDRPCFLQLQRFRDEGRFVVSPDGPRNGAVEAPKMNRRLVDAILSEADVLFFKGARSYEMIATGIRLPTFSGQTVAREFSESVTGAAASAGVPVLRFFQAFPDFWGFTKRHLRVAPLFPTGELGWQATMTAIDSARFTASRIFRQACSLRGLENVAIDIVKRAEERSIPLHAVSP
jgi:hypothetical protein